MSRAAFAMRAAARIDPNAACRPSFVTSTVLT